MKPLYVTILAAGMLLTVNPVWPATRRISSFIAATILMTTSSKPQTRYWASRGPLGPPKEPWLFQALS
jgi:hypothetical protein